MTYERNPDYPILVVRYVGKGLAEEEDGLYYIDDEGRKISLDLHTTVAIRGAAMESLKRVHLSGVNHGDIALRNLRVAVKVNADLNLQEDKRVCWIDFGRSHHDVLTAFVRTLE